MEHKKFVPEFRLFNTLAYNLVTLGGLSFLTYGPALICALTTLTMWFLPLSLSNNHWSYGLFLGCAWSLMINIFSIYSKKYESDVRTTGLDKIIGLFFCLQNIPKTPVYFIAVSSLLYYLSMYKPWPLSVINFKDPTANIIVKIVGPTLIVQILVQLFLRLSSYIYS